MPSLDLTPGSNNNPLYHDFIHMQHIVALKT